MKTISICIALFIATGASAQDIERINPAGMTQPTAYSHLVKFDKMLFIAGQVALDGDGNIIGEGDMAAQLRQVFENLKAVAQAAGGDLDQVVKLTIFLTDLANFATVNSVMEDFFEQPFPARAAVGVASLPKGADVEADAILAF